MKKDTGHTYFNAKGLQVPGVTTVLGVLNKPGLVRWANTLGFYRIDVDAFLEERAAIGTDFHKMVEEYMKGEPVGGKHFTEAIELFDRFRIWQKSHYYKVFQTELSLVGKSYGGTIDAIGEVDGCFTVIDYKTSKKIYDEQFIQLAGYGLLIKELLPETYEKIESFGVISMRSTTPYKTKNKKDIEKTFMPIFKNLLKVYESCQEIGMKTYMR